MEIERTTEKVDSEIIIIFKDSKNPITRIIKMEKGASSTTIITVNLITTDPEDNLEGSNNQLTPSKMAH